MFFSNDARGDGVGPTDTKASDRQRRLRAAARAVRLEPLEPTPALRRDYVNTVNDNEQCAMR